jgi:hypothetical protein
VRTADFRKELQHQVTALEKQLREVRSGLQRRPATVTTTSAPSAKKTAKKKSETTDAPIVTQLRSLVSKAGVFVNKTGGKAQLSLSTGLHMQDLHVSCGVSYEKMPRVFQGVLSSLLGCDAALAEEYCALLRSPDTCSAAAEIASALSAKYFHDQFTSRAGETTVLNSHLMLDDSNKGINLSIMPCTVQMTDGTVALRGLSTVHALTKAHTASSRLIDSILADVGDEGLSRVFGGTTDAFGAAVATMQEMLQAADTKAANLPQPLQYQCRSNPTVVLDWSVPFRQLCQFTCLMHAFERIQHDPLDAFLQELGLKNDGATSQLIYAARYFAKKECDVRNALLLIAAGGTAAGVRGTSRKARRYVRQISSARWRSRPEACAQTRDSVNIVAAAPLIARAAELCGGEQSADWQRVRQYARCFDSDDLSHTILTYFVQAHQCTKESADNCWRIFKFLCTPAHRMSVVVVACLLPMQARWSAFADGQSKLFAAKTYSTRALELVAFQRGLLEDVYRLKLVGLPALPGAWEFLERETLRAEQLPGLQHTRYIPEFMEMFAKSADKMWEQALKYCLEPSLKGAPVILHLTCSATAPHFAHALLALLRQDGQDCGPAFDAVSTSSANAPPVDAVWTAASRQEAYPGMTFPQLRTRLTDALSSKDMRQTLYAAYALNAPPVIAELILIARGQLRDAGNDRTTESHWAEMGTRCPVLREILEVSFKTVTVSTACAEQVFSAGKQICLPNNSESSHRNALHHHQNVRRALIERCDESGARDPETNGAAQATTGRATRRPLRSASSLVSYYQELHSLAAELKAMSLPVPTKRSLRGPGKRLQAIMDNQEDVLKVMEENGRKRKRPMGDLAAEIVCMDTGKLDKKTTIGKTALQSVSGLLKNQLMDLLDGHVPAKELKRMLKPQLAQMVAELGLHA